MKTTRILLLRLCLAVFVIVSFATSSFGQWTLIPSPHAPVDLRPHSATPDYQDTARQLWIPDCSQEVLSTPVQQLYKYGNDNNGNLRLDRLSNQFPVRMYRASHDSSELILPFKNRSAYGGTNIKFDRSFDAVTDGNGGAVYAYEKFVKSCEFDGSGNAYCIRNPRIPNSILSPAEDHVGYKVYVQGIDSNGSLISPSRPIDSSPTIQTDPKIVSWGGGYIVVWIEGNPDISTSNIKPYKLMAADVTGGWTTALTGTENFAEIQEFSVENDQHGGAVILAIVKNDTTDGTNHYCNHLLLQDINGTTGITNHKGLADDLLGDTTSMGIVDNSTYYKYHPIIKNAGGISNVHITNGGSGYLSAPTVSFTGGGGNGASATAHITGGVVTSITMVVSGFGYSSLPTVSFSGGSGSGAAATAISGKYHLAYALIDNPRIDSGSATLHLNSYISSDSGLTFHPPFGTTFQKVDYLYIPSTTSAMTEFYMTPFSDQGSPAAAVLAKDGNGDLKLWEFDMSNLNLIVTHTPVAPQIFGLTNYGGDASLYLSAGSCTQTGTQLGTVSTNAFPGGIYNDNDSINHLIIIYYDIPSGGSGWSCYAAAYNTTTGLAWTAWPYITDCSATVAPDPIDLKDGITSTVFQLGGIGQHSNYLFTVIPDLNEEYIVKLNLSNGGITSPAYVTPVNVRTSTINFGTNDVYTHSFVSGSNFFRANFESGITGFQNKYFRRFQFATKTPAYEEDREAQAWNSDLNVQSYSTSSSSLSANFGSDVRICGTKMQHGLHSSAFEDIEATVWESFTPDGVSDIFIAKRGSAPLQITSGSSSTVKYINPKVAVFRSGVNPYACVTYVKEYFSSGNFFSEIVYRIVNLTTLTANSEIGIDASSSPVDELTGPNFDLVMDSITHCMYSIYGKGFLPGTTSTTTALYAARIDSNGSINWYGLRFDGGLSGFRSEISTGYTSNNGSTPGLYVVWREEASGNVGIMLNFIYSTNTVWAGGPIAHNNGAFDRHDPCVAASNKWVMLAWDDTYNGGSAPHERRIYASGHYNDGSYLPGWQNPVMIDSASLPNLDDDTCESHHPSIVASVPSNSDSTREGCLIAFTEDNDGSSDDAFNNRIYDEFEELDPNFEMRIGLRFIWARRIIYLPGDTVFRFEMPPQKHLKMNPIPSPNTDLTNALFGTYQQNPKLIQMKAGAFPNPPQFDNSSSWLNMNDSNPNVLCVFETMPVASLAFTGTENTVPFFGILQEANLEARLVTALGDASFEHYCIASGQGKQILGNLTHTNELGFLASYLDYGASDNYTADVKNVSVNNEVYYTTGTIHVPPPFPKVCGNLNAGPIISGTGAVTAYNRSTCDLNIYLDEWQLRLPNWGVSGSRVIGTGGVMTAYTSDASTFTMSYAPIHFCDAADHVAPLFSVGEFFGLYINADYTSARTDTGSQKISAYLSDTSGFTFTVRPNPVMNDLTLEIKGMKNRNMVVGFYNIIGENLSNEALNPLSDDASFTISTNSLSAGNYIVRVTLDGQYVQSQMITVIK